MDSKINNIVAGTFAVLGIFSISCGLILPGTTRFESTDTGKLEVLQERVAEIKTNEIKLKDITIDINNYLSTNVSDYLEDPNNIDDNLLKTLKLDTSNVNINVANTYKYTITCNKKIYTGTITVNEKKLPVVQSMTLNQLSYELNTTLPTDISTYIKEQLTDEVKQAIRIDLSNVNTTKAGIYLYSVSYNGNFYTSTITIYEPRVTQIEEEKSEIKEETIKNKDEME